MKYKQCKGFTLVGYFIEKNGHIKNILYMQHVLNINTRVYNMHDIHLSTNSTQRQYQNEVKICVSDIVTHLRRILIRIYNLYTFDNKLHIYLKICYYKHQNVYIFSKSLTYIL